MNTSSVVTGMVLWYNMSIAHTFTFEVSILWLLLLLKSIIMARLVAKSLIRQTGLIFRIFKNENLVIPQRSTSLCFTLLSIFDCIRTRTRHIEHSKPPLL